MNHYATIRAALELLEWRVLESERNNQPIVATRRQLDDALSALAELEKAASEPVGELTNAGMVHTHPFTVLYSSALPSGTKLYAAPPAVAAAPPVPAVEVTDAVARKVFNAWIDARWRMNEGQDVKYGRAMIGVVQAELGPALGLSVWREPTDAECRLMESLLARMNLRLDTSYGRDIFDCVREVIGGVK